MPLATKTYDKMRPPKYKGKFLCIDHKSNWVWTTWEWKLQRGEIVLCCCHLLKAWLLRKEIFFCWSEQREKGTVEFHFKTHHWNCLDIYIILFGITEIIWVKSQIIQAKFWQDEKFSTVQRSIQFDMLSTFSSSWPFLSPLDFVINTWLDFFTKAPKAKHFTQSQDIVSCSCFTGCTFCIHYLT